MCENFLRFRPFGPELWAKRVFPKMRLSHFLHIFYVEANVRISYMGTFFEAMVLKLCTGYLVHITEYVWKFFAISPIWARIMGKKGFFQKWDLVIFSTLRQMQEFSTWALFFKLWFWNFAQGILSILRTMCENFLRFCPFGPELWAKRVFIFSTFSTLRQM